MVGCLWYIRISSHQSLELIAMKHSDLFFSWEFDVVICPIFEQVVICKKSNHAYMKRLLPSDHRPDFPSPSLQFELHTRRSTTSDRPTIPTEWDSRFKRL